MAHLLLLGSGLLRGLGFLHRSLLRFRRLGLFRRWLGDLLRLGRCFGLLGRGFLGLLRSSCSRRFGFLLSLGLGRLLHFRLSGSGGGLALSLDGQLERAGRSLAFRLGQSTGDDRRLEVLPDEGRQFLGVDLVVGRDVLFDGLQRGTATLLQVLDGGVHHVGGGRVAGLGAGLLARRRRLGLFRCGGRGRCASCGVCHIGLSEKFQ